ncbi:hypothetical protein RJT34_16875 [Clitoria ternatea]|uniref:Uncharacterized protein n=1 Tax=Clitoria ternatea TaxID=43366 RepID=A0AAN9J866_CLITE
MRSNQTKQNTVLSALSHLLHFYVHFLVPPSLPPSLGFPFLFASAMLCAHIHLLNSSASLHVHFLYCFQLVGLHLHHYHRLCSQKN